jgi:hypothetical protein
MIHDCICCGCNCLYLRDIKTLVIFALRYIYIYILKIFLVIRDESNMTNLMQIKGILTVEEETSNGVKTCESKFNFVAPHLCNKDELKTIVHKSIFDKTKMKVDHDSIVMKFSDNIYVNDDTINTYLREGITILVTGDSIIE